jgi:hypothetical protein
MSSLHFLTLINVNNVSRRLGCLALRCDDGWLEPIAGFFENARWERYSLEIELAFFQDFGP